MVVVHFTVFTHMLQEYIVSSSSLKKIPKLFLCALPQRWRYKKIKCIYIYTRGNEEPIEKIKTKPTTCAIYPSGGDLNDEDLTITSGLLFYFFLERRSRRSCY